MAENCNKLTVRSLENVIVLSKSTFKNRGVGAQDNRRSQDLNAR